MAAERVPVLPPDLDFRLASYELTLARQRLDRQRATILGLEGELKGMLRLRGRVVRALVLLNEADPVAARRELVEVLEGWPG